MTEGGRSRGWWARPAGLVAIGVVIALAIGGTVWAVTSSSGENNATPTQPTTPTTGDTVLVPDVVTGTVVSAAELTLQGVRLQYMLETQPASACTLPSGAYNQNAVLWQMPAAGSVVPVGTQVSLGVC